MLVPKLTCWFNAALHRNHQENFGETERNGCPVHLEKQTYEKSQKNSSVFITGGREWREGMRWTIRTLKQLWSFNNQEISSREENGWGIKRQSQKTGPQKKELWFMTGFLNLNATGDQFWQLYKNVSRHCQISRRRQNCPWFMITIFQTGGWENRQSLLNC